MTCWMWSVVAGVMGLGYVYGGYLILLRVFIVLRGRVPNAAGANAVEGPLPTLTVFFSAFNEETLVERRLRNLLSQEYPRDRLEIIVVSDGSTDGTASIARHIASEQAPGLVRVLDWRENRGRHAAQNAVSREARGEILLTTDADSEFEPGFLLEVGRAFRDPAVGVAGGVLRYRSSTDGIARGHAQYRGMEYKLREAEEALGILVKTDGPCTAYRKAVWEEIEEFEDVDHVVVLLARRRGLRAVQLPGAVCWDTPNAGWRQEMRARSRMTRKGILSIRKRWQSTQVLRQPAFSFALYSHRYARYLSPLFLLLAALGALGALAQVLPGTVFAGVCLVGLAAAWGLLQSSLADRGTFGQVRGFLVANLGFALGIVGWLRGDRTGRYRPTRGTV